jgi:hypothetical protein
MLKSQLDDFKKSGILPLEVYDQSKESLPTTEITICDGMSGGAGEIDNMPRVIRLTRLKLIDGKWKEFHGTYELLPKPRLNK